MKRILENNNKTRKRLQKLSRIYVLDKFDNYLVYPVIYSGKCTRNGIPIIWNPITGLYGITEYRLCSIYDIPNSTILCWSTKLSDIITVLNDITVS